MKEEEVQGKATKKVKKTGDLPCEEKTVKGLGFFGGDASGYHQLFWSMANTLNGTSESSIITPRTPSCPIPAQTGSLRPLGTSLGQTRKSRGTGSTLMALTLGRQLWESAPCMWWERAPSSGRGCSPWEEGDPVWCPHHQPPYPWDNPRESLLLTVQRAHTETTKVNSSANVTLFKTRLLKFRMGCHGRPNPGWSMQPPDKPLPH